MSFTTTSIEVPIPGVINTSDAALPSKEFIGYDPKGTTTVTGSPNERAESPNVNQPQTDGGRLAQASPPATEESVTLSPKLTAIARREQAQRQREVVLKQREKDLEAKLAKAEKFESLEQRIAKKDYSAAEELGLTYEEYTNHLVSKQAEKNPEAERVSKVEAELIQLKKEREEQVLRDYESNQKLWKQEISRVVSADEELTTFEKRAKENGLLEEGKSFSDLILQHINDSFEEDEIELSAEEAAKEIKEALLGTAKKYSSLLGNTTFDAPAKRLGAPKTITQNMTVTSEKPSTKPFHLMSDSEQIAEAFRRVQAAKQQR